MITILLTDPEQRAALAAARALGRRGWRVVTIGTAKGLAGASRSVARHVALTATDTSTPARYLAAIAAVVRREQVQVIIPVTDAASRRLLGQDVAVGAKVAGP
jgi:hypothetical protein